MDKTTPLQYLNPEGELQQAPPGFATPDTLKYLYYRMHLLRELDDRAVKLQRTGKMGTYPAARGQEAIGVGSGSALQANDVICPYYRDQGVLLQHGVSIAEILQYWGGDERGSDFQASSAREDFPIAVPIATQFLHATGIAYAMKLRRQARAVLTAGGDGSTSKGDFYEALNVAGAWQLPVVFVINNNQWAISVPRQAQTHCETLAQKAIAGGFEGIQVDGNDVIAMRDATEQALDKARQGGGPTLIEALSYRLCDHTTADDASRYENQADREQAQAAEPIKRLREYLIAQNLWSTDDETALQTRCHNEIKQAVAEYQAVPPGKPTDMLNHLYANLPDALLDQYDILNQAQHEDHS